MFGLMALGGLIMTALLAVFVLGAVLFVIKAVFLVLGLTFRLVLLPVKLVLGLVFLPILAVGGVLALGGLLVAGIVGVVVPLLPLLLVGLVIWALVKALTRPAAVVR